jgi:hypothetical protein
MAAPDAGTEAERSDNGQIRLSPFSSGGIFPQGKSSEIEQKQKMILSEQPCLSLWWHFGQQQCE